MKICPKCDIHHSKDGIFCSRQCANSRGPRTEKFKALVRKKLVGRKVPPETLLKIAEARIVRTGKFPNPIEEKICLCCGILFETNRPIRKYCSKLCYLNYYKIIRSDWEQFSIDCAFKFMIIQLGSTCN